MYRLYCMLVYSGGVFASVGTERNSVKCLCLSGLKGKL